MKNLNHILTTLFFGFVAFAYGQQEAQLNLHETDPFFLNPAGAGLSECVHYSAIHRRQWTSAGTPITSSFVHAHNGYGNKKLEKFKPGWHGVGIQASMDVNSNFEQYRLNVAYAYHLKVKKNAILSFGSFWGFRSFGFNRSNYFIKDNNDPVFGGDSRFFTLLDISPGILYNTKKWMLGASIWNLAKTKMSGFGSAVGSPSDLRMTTYINGAYRFTYNYDFHLTPSFQIRQVQQLPPSFDLNLLWDFDNTFGIGGGWKYQNGFFASIQLRIIEKIHVAYAFDYSIQRLRYGFQYSHEIMIAYRPCPGKSMMDSRFYCPAYGLMH